MWTRLQQRIPRRAWIEASELLARLRPGFFSRRVERPTFIVSAGRSGTTLLNYLFDAHPDVANYPNEANNLWHPRLYPFSESKVDAPPFWLDPHGFTRASLAQRTPRDDEHLKATFGAFQTLQRGSVFLNKMVMVTFMLDKVVELFPDARFIHLYRDGRAVAASWAIKDKEKVQQNRYRERGIEYSDDQLLEQYAKHWQAHVLALEAAAAKHRWRQHGKLHELSYEALCADPRKELIALAAFMGVSERPFLEGDLREIKNTNFKSRETVQGLALEKLNRVAAEGLALKGYGADIR